MTDRKPYWAVAVAVAFIAAAVVNGYRNVGWIVVVIIGMAAVGGLTMWLLTTFHKPAEPKVIVPLYLLSLVGLKIHIIEEYLMEFPEAMSHTFGIHFTQDDFVLEIALGLWVVWLLGAVGLMRRNPLGNFVCWFLFMGMMFSELTHFWFPTQSPDHRLYFPGMYTALLPGIPAWIGAIYLVRNYWKGGKPTVESATAPTGG